MATLTGADTGKDSKFENIEKQITTLKTSLSKIDKWLENAYANRKILRKAELDTILKVSLIICDLVNSSGEVKSIVDKYNANSLSLINSEVRQLQTLIKINDIKQKLLYNEPQNSNSAIKSKTTGTISLQESNQNKLKAIKLKDESDFLNKEIQNL